jgi:Na+/melibiose symporter-like transporter
MSDRSSGQAKPTMAAEKDREANPRDDLANASPLGVLEMIQTTEKHHPIHWPVWQKWCVSIIYCLLQVLVTILSTSYVSAEYYIQDKFGGSTQVVALGQSLFIVGTAVGPAFLGPLSDIGGRKWVYVASIVVYGLLQIVRITHAQ